MREALGPHSEATTAQHADGHHNASARERLRLEIVSNCKPLHACIEGSHTLRNLTRAGGLHILQPRDGHVAAIVALAKVHTTRPAWHDGRRAHHLPQWQVTRLGWPNAAVMYDQIRCARCRSAVIGAPTVQPWRSHSFVSTFWEQIVRLHRRFGSGAAYGEVALERLAEMVPPRVRARDVFDFGLLNPEERRAFYGWNLHLWERQGVTDAHRLVPGTPEWREAYNV